MSFVSSSSSAETDGLTARNITTAALFYLIGVNVVWMSSLMPQNSKSKREPPEVNPARLLPSLSRKV